MKMIRKGLWKKWCAGVSAICLAMTGALAGGLPGGIVRSLPDGLAEALPAELAGNVPGSVAHAEEGDVAMGRYLESELAMPAEDFGPLDVVRTAEGTLRMLGVGDNGYTIWDSADGGVSWEQTGAFPEEYAKKLFYDIDLSPTGGGVASGYEADDEDELQNYLIAFDAQGNVTARRDADSSYTMDFAQNGKLIGMEPRGDVLVFDPETVESGSTIASGADMIGTCGEEALVLMPSQLQRYDIASGEPLSRDEPLEEALYAGGSDLSGGIYTISSTASVPIVMAEDEEGRLYYGTGDGIFAHAMDGSVVEQVVDGTLGTLASPSTFLCAMAVADQCFYLVCFDDAEHKLLKYEYSADTPSVPQKELTIYSLTEQSELREAITLFQKKYPDIYVNYEIGMSGEDGVTASDALRTLNTEILAGSGPDVLVLDSLPVDSYAEQGLLTDLSGIVAELQDSEGLMDNVLGAYEQDGAFYAVPQRFGIVMAAGKPELISGIDSFDAIEALAAQQGTVSSFTIFTLPQLLYRVSAGAWKNEDGTLDQEKLAQYVHAVRQITETWKANASQEEVEKLGMLQQEEMYSWNAEEQILGIKGDDLMSSVMQLLIGDCTFYPGALYQMTDYCGLTSINKQNGDCAVALSNLSEEKFFVPCGLLGVLGTSKEPEQAEELVRFLLSAETQKQISSDGFPLNRTALEDRINTDSLGDGFGVYSGDEEGNMFGLEYEWPTDVEREALMAMAQQVSVPVETERVQQDVVIEEMQRCLSGETSEDEAVNAILQRINLYLAE